MMIYLICLILLIEDSFQSLTVIKQVELHTSIITSIQTSNDKSLVITSSLDKTFKVWDATTYKLIHTQTFTTEVNALAILRSTNQIIVLLNNGNVNVYNADTLSVITTYAYPNGGYANSIQFSIDNSFYMLAGKDVGLNPNIHFFDSATHSLTLSLPTLFSSSSQITKMVNFYTLYLFVISDQNTAPFAVQIYHLPSVSLIKRLTSSNAQLLDISIALDGSYFYSIALDMALRNYSSSPYNNIYQQISLEYFTSNLSAINSNIPGVVYMASTNTLTEFFVQGAVNLATDIKVDGTVSIMKMDYPKLTCATTQGKLIVYSIFFFDGTDTQMTKWYILSSVMGLLIIILFVGLIVEVYIKKKMEKLQQNQKNQQELAIQQFPLK